jgi:hypothetical protein
VSALSMGRIQGANARAATVTRVSGLPSRAESDVWVTVATSESFDALAPLTDHFYTALAALHGQVRAWEKSAEPKKMLDLETYAGLWEDSLEVVEKSEQSVEDAYGRRLALHRLPDDLLALADPRQVVIDGTRLPEDVEPWIPWVRERRK